MIKQQNSSEARNQCEHTDVLKRDVHGAQDPQLPTLDEATSSKGAHKSYNL